MEEKPEIPSMVSTGPEALKNMMGKGDGESLNVELGEKQLPRKKAESQCGHLVATIGIADKTLSENWRGS